MITSVSSRLRRNLLHLAALACGLAAGLAEPSPLRADGTFAAIDAYVLREMEAAGVPGAALAIVKGERIVHLRGLGTADGSERPVQPDTPFIIGSTGKSITALAILQLAEAGKIDLDAPVQRYLPWFRLREAEASARITVRHLLNQTSGIPTRSGLDLQNDPDQSDLALERHVRRIADFPLSGEPGERFEYSNANYTTLGLIVQTVSGLPYEEYIRQNIFEPLDMRRSFTSKDEARKAGLATGFRQWLRYPVAAPDLPYVRGELPAGYHISTAEDMAHLLIAQLNGGRYGDRSILSAEGIAEQQRPVAEGRPGVRYAMGWQVGSLEGVKAISHGGAVPNYMTDLIMLPEQGWGVALLMNTSNGLFMARLMEIGDNVARQLIGKAPVEPTESVIAWPLLGILGGLALVQLGLGLRTIRRRLKCRATGGPDIRTGSPRRLWAAVLLFLLNAGLVAVLWLVLPGGFGVRLPVLVLFQPDVGALLIACGLFALTWAAVQFWTAGKLLRKR